MRTRSLLQPRVGAVLALEDPALGGHVESVHDFRVATRSLRASLRTLTRRPDSALVRQARRVLQKATRALADARDRDVGHALLSRLPFVTPEQSALKRRLLGLSSSDRRVALIACLAHWPRELDRLLVALLKRAEPSVKSIIMRTRAEAWQQRHRALLVLKVVGRRFNPVLLHELRRRIRSLRYAVEVLSEVDSGAHARVVQLKPLQSALGDTQDRIVLSRWLSLQASRFSRTDRALSLALREAAAHFKAQSIEAHATFLRLKPGNILEGLALHVDAPDRPRRPVPASHPAPGAAPKASAARARKRITRTAG